MDSRTSRVRAFFQTGSYLATRAPIAVRVELVHELLGDLDDARILDLGCGDGSLSLQYAARSSITLVDLSTNMLERARENTPRGARERVRYVNSAADAFTSEQPFDVVLCIGLLAHVASIDQTVAKVASLVRPGGRCIFQITDRDRLMGRALSGLFGLRTRIRNSAGYDLTPTGSAELVRIASRHGLRQLDERRTWSILPGMRFLPDEVLLRYQRNTSRNPLLSRRGAEALLLFGH
jgi:cyclopropane fatty-acyl-phospholipid synthase-like methyltransferase